MAIAPIASDNERAVSAMINAYGFSHDRTIDRWYDPKDLAIYVEDTGTKPYQNIFDCITAGNNWLPFPSSIKINGICANGNVSLSCSTHCFRRMTIIEAPTTKRAI